MGKPTFSLPHVKHKSWAGELNHWLDKTHMVLQERVLALATQPGSVRHQSLTAIFLKKANGSVLPSWQ